MRHRKNRYPGVMYAYSVQAIRDAEAPLIGPDDALMKQAAGHVAQAAATLLAETLPNAAYPGNVLVVAGSGGNGGDGLYAGAELARAGITSRRSESAPEFTNAPPRHSNMLAANLSPSLGIMTW